MIYDKKGNQVVGTAPLDSSEFTYDETTKTVKLNTSSFFKFEEFGTLTATSRGTSTGADTWSFDLPAIDNGWKLRQLNFTLDDDTNGQYFTEIVVHHPHTIPAGGTNVYRYLLSDISLLPRTYITNGTTRLRIIDGLFYSAGSTNPTKIMIRADNTATWRAETYTVHGFYILQKKD